ncbi:YigZ family protein [Streptomyces zingiberis]|uniref:YigZ family protein n=1 Tax=Streptomyces zingiberis TaxID=2053010 RepID=A0ABX1BV31_9ACTN|nr:YigZ family protein [Streptomyces zingiberis]NJQ01589.1 YigZ family protein [Streptomyces zingiberis]
MQDGQHRTVAGEGVHETEVRKSRFLTTLAPAATEEEARAVIRRVRERDPGATHHCWAYVLGPAGAVRKSSDDGEPGGTAGVPMLQMLLRREVRDVVAVVTRHFGGVQLGAGGLIRAYGGAVGQALDALGTVARHPVRLATVTVDHGRAGRLENDLRATGRTVRGVRYGARVAIEVGVAETDLERFREWLADATAGTAALELGQVTYRQDAGDGQG